MSFSDHEDHLRQADEPHPSTDPPVDPDEWDDYLFRTGGAADTPLPGQLIVSREVRSDTDASIWLIRPDTYMRMPHTECDRMTLNMVGQPALVDRVWHQHTGAWVRRGVHGPIGWLTLPDGVGNGWVASGFIRTIRTDS